MMISVVKKIIFLQIYQENQKLIKFLHGLKEIVYEKNVQKQQNSFKNIDGHES